MDDELFRYHDIKNLVRSFADGKRYPLEFVGHIIQAQV